MKKGVSVLVIVALATGLLTACSSKNDQKTDNQNMPGMNQNDMKNMPGMDHNNMKMDDKK